jgi:hypothetical protein
MPVMIKENTWALQPAGEFGLGHFFPDRRQAMIASHHPIPLPIPKKIDGRRCTDESP